MTPVMYCFLFSFDLIDHPYDVLSHVLFDLVADPCHVLLQALFDLVDDACDVLYIIL